MTFTEDPVAMLLGLSEEDRAALVEALVPLVAPRVVEGLGPMVTRTSEGTATAAAKQEVNRLLELSKNKKVIQRKLGWSSWMVAVIILCVITAAFAAFGWWGQDLTRLQRTIVTGLMGLVAAISATALYLRTRRTRPVSKRKIRRAQAVLAEKRASERGSDA